MLGSLGGLGPAASCYLYQMLIDHTPATCDQDHIDIVISSRASTPDRTAFIMGKSKDDPFAVMEQDGFSLVHYGATVLAIPCNTAHYFYDRLAEALPVPVLNMPRLTVADAKAAGCTKLGILATDGTLAAETYQLACQAQGIDWAVPSEEHQQEVMSVIYDDIKQGKRADMAKFGAAVHDLKKQYYAANMDIARKNEALFVILEALRPTHYLAVITTGSRQNATEMLDHFHCTDWFDLILTQEDVVNNKPDPEGYLKAMAHFGVDAAHTMIFEDSATGLAAARATGASVFACNQF